MEEHSLGCDQGTSRLKSMSGPIRVRCSSHPGGHWLLYSHANISRQTFLYLPYTSNPTCSNPGIEALNSSEKHSARGGRHSTGCGEVHCADTTCTPRGRKHKFAKTAAEQNDLKFFTAATHQKPCRSLETSLINAAKTFWWACTVYLCY